MRFGVGLVICIGVGVVNGVTAARAGVGGGLCSETRIVIDADNLQLGTLLEKSVISHLRDDLLQAMQDTRGLALVVTDWKGRMPEEMWSVLGEVIRSQGSAAGRSSMATSCA